MRKNEFIEIVKSHLKEHVVDYTVKNEKFHGPYWSITIESNSYIVQIYGDIGFDIEISIEEEKLSLWRIDRSLVDKTKTSSINIRTQMDSLIKIIKP